MSVTTPVHARLHPAGTLRRTAWAVVAAALVAFAVFEAVKHGGWIAAAVVVGAVAPDLTLLVGAGGGPVPHGHLPRAAVRPYNLAHHPLPPLLLVAVTSFVPGAAAVFAVGLAWLAHIAVDRACGYGPRRPDGSRAGDDGRVSTTAPRLPSPLRSR